MKGFSPGRIAAVLAGVLAMLVAPRRARADAGRGGPAGEGWLKAVLSRWGLVAAALLVLAGIAGGSVLVSGLVPIKASSGHWRITELVLQFAKQRSIATHSLGTRVPPLDDPALVTKGAGHFEFGCRPCHGSPWSERPRVAAAMLPQPPELRSIVERFDAAELFYIVKHGLKFTGMPAWPAPGRDDEVWSVVAFLTTLPNLTRGEYERLTSEEGDAAEPVAPIEDLVPPGDAPAAIVDSCARCHGRHGHGRGIGAFPRLAGQRPDYLAASLGAYARSDRRSGVMEPIAAALEPADIADVSAYYAQVGRAPRRTDVAGVTPPSGRGSVIATRGLPDRLVPPCEKCHGPGAAARNPMYPSLAGQYASYIRLQLGLFQSQSRGGTPYHRIMQRVAANLTPADIRDVAEYYAGLDPDRER
ncbi:MAG: c-type cytochrome [Vicinamibacterales bacterium]